MTGSGSMVDAELRRMIDEAGVSPFGPPSSTYRGVDLRDIRTEDGRSAYEVYQELAGKPSKGPSLKETVARIMLTEAYGRAPDGDADQKGTRQAMLTGTVAKYREAAGKLLLKDANVRRAVFEQRVKGNAAVARKDGVKSDREVGAGYLERLGRATGLDLGGVLAGSAE